MTLEIDGRSWRTPVTAVIGRRVGNARLKRHVMAPGFYPMENTNGHAVYRLTSPCATALLQRRDRGGAWSEWMTDDPLHWLSMRQRVADLPPGKVLCAGLGLGLMVHHLVARSDITAITVVEIDPDVIALIKPTLPADPRVTIVNADFYEFLDDATEKFDSILWDLAVGTAETSRNQLITGFALTCWKMPGVPFYQFGVRDAVNIFTPKSATKEK